MRFSVVALIVAAGSLVAAQTSDSCTAKAILLRCLEDTKPQVTTCVSNDYACLCNRQKAVLTCFNNCPNDQGIHAQQATVTALCNAADQVADSNSRVSEAANSTKTTSSDSSTKTSTTAASKATGDETKEEDSAAKEEEKKDAPSAAAPVGVQKLFVVAAALAAAAAL